MLGGRRCIDRFAAIHFSVIGEHFEEVWYFGVLFMAVASFQVGWAIAIVVRPTRRLLAAGAVLQALLVVIYLWSCTTGLPVGPEPWSPEAVAFLDVLATVFEVIAAVGAVVLILRSLDRPLSRGVSVAAVGSDGAARRRAHERKPRPRLSGDERHVSDVRRRAASSMAAMGAASGSGTTLSLATTSPAGNIVWPAVDGSDGERHANGGPASAQPTRRSANSKPQSTWSTRQSLTPLPIEA